MMLQNNKRIVFFIFKMIALQWWARGIQSYHMPSSFEFFGNRLVIASRRRVSSTLVCATSDGFGWKHSHLRCTSRNYYYSSLGDCTDNLAPFEECWETTTLAVNPSDDENIDNILQGLNSPAPQSFFVLDRAIKIYAKTDNASFEFALQECSYLIKPGWKLVVHKPNHNGIDFPGIPWTLLPPSSTELDDFGENYSTLVVSEGSSGPNACQLSAEALLIVSEASDTQQPIDDNAIETLVDAMVERLKLTLGTDIRGRTSADIAFNICLAGIQDEFLFDTLTKIARLEMERVGHRPSRRAKDILHVVEKLAAAGVKGAEVERVYQLAAKSLAAKDLYPEIVKLLSTPGQLDLLSPRPLLWLWRYSSRLQKPSVQAFKASSTAWWHQFQDPTRPLIIDVGCGLGVSLIGLASQSNDKEPVHPSDTSVIFQDIDLTQCNYLGGDLNEATVRFANTISSRWNLSGKLQFIQASAEDMLDQIEHHSNYPGGLSLVLIHFPSPWRLKKGNGNSQLPTGPDDGFMVSATLMEKISQLLKKNRRARSSYLLMQTNCEDVAVALRDRASDVGLISVPAIHPVTSPAEQGRLPERTIEWIRNGGERAVGQEWSTEPLLPERCATETEVACEIQGTPVHRCLFKST
jgi:SAM-dependent methyltransferase